MKLIVFIAFVCVVRAAPSNVHGARLASPLTQGLYGSLRALMNEGRKSSLFTGVHTMSTRDDYYSIEGVNLMEIPLEWAEGQPDKANGTERCLALLPPGVAADVDCDSLHPFACYREKVGIMAMNECGNYDNQYVKNKRTGSCYKYHTGQAEWLDANAVCSAEGGHLAIINSHREAEILKELVIGNKQQMLNTPVFVGMVNWFNDDLTDRKLWVTLDDMSPKEAGFAVWKNGVMAIKGNNCGGLVLSGGQPELTPRSCDEKTPFICEIEAPRKPWSL